MVQSHPINPRPLIVIECLFFPFVKSETPFLANFELPISLTIQCYNRPSVLEMYCS